MVDHTLEGALKDISSIRRIMSQVEGTRGTPLTAPHSINTALLIHIVALIFSSALLVQELGLSPFTGGELTASLVLELSLTNHLLRAMLVVSTGIFLATLSIVLYAILWTAARGAQEDLSSYLKRNFRSFSLLSFLSDLLVKFSGVTIIIYTGHPEWLSPFLLLCIADYLFQGRFFQLPIKSSFAVALTALVLAGSQLITHSSHLSIALTAFVTVTIASMFVVLSSKRSFQHKAQVEVESHG
jgi:hypothetical protein